MGCGCGGRSYTRRTAAQPVNYNQAPHQARTINPPAQHAPTTRPPVQGHVVQSAALVARRAQLRRQV
jgi:hypothetical protein